MRILPLCLLTAFCYVCCLHVPCPGQELLPADELSQDEGTSHGFFNARGSMQLMPAEEDSGNLFVNEWWVLGPFDQASRLSSRSLPKHQQLQLARRLPPSKKVNLAATFLGAQDKVLQWTFMRSERPRVEPFWSPRACTYLAYTTVHVKEDGKYWVSLGADDLGKLWVDGKLTWMSDSRLKTYRPDEYTAELSLSAGRHELMMEVQNNGGTMGWSMIFHGMLMAVSKADVTIAAATDRRDGTVHYRWAQTVKEHQLAGGGSREQLRDQKLLASITTARSNGAVGRIFLDATEETPWQAMAGLVKQLTKTEAEDDDGLFWGLSHLRFQQDGEQDGLLIHVQATADKQAGLYTCLRRQGSAVTVLGTGHDASLAHCLELIAGQDKLDQAVLHTHGKVTVQAVRPVLHALQSAGVTRLACRHNDAVLDDAHLQAVVATLPRGEALTKWCTDLHGKLEARLAGLNAEIKTLSKQLAANQGPEAVEAFVAARGQEGIVDEKAAGEGLALKLQGIRLVADKLLKAIEAKRALSVITKYRFKPEQALTMVRACPFQWREDVGDVQAFVKDGALTDMQVVGLRVLLADVQQVMAWVERIDGDVAFGTVRSGGVE